MIEAFPLQWPLGYNRTPHQKIKRSQFKATLGQARDGVLNEIQRLGGRNAIISSNIPIKKDGNLYASQKPIDGDHGVAVYFTWNNEQMVLACDAYISITENLRAIEKSIEAMRGLERWGASDILKRSFSGFKALPEQGTVNENNSWWSVLGVTPFSSYDEVKKAYRQKVAMYHPDNVTTGDRMIFDSVFNAMKEAERHLQQNA